MTSAVQPGDRIAVTGATGFVGQTLVKHLSDSGYLVVGIAERREPPQRISDLLEDYFCVDLSSGWPRTPSLDGIVHLAGLAAVGPSFEQPQHYISTNSAIVSHLFEFALRQDWRGRAVIVSSGAVYDASHDGNALSEGSATAATSPYVVSKLLVECQTDYYRRRGIDALIARPFNHVGPGQNLGFIVPDLATKITEWQPGAIIPVGNLDSARDYTDVRDIVAAYELLLERAEPRYTTYNVCSGTATPGWKVLETICTALGRPMPLVEVIDRRAIDPSVVRGNAERLRHETGWRPSKSLRESISDFLDAAG